jgi:hypothetical protein
LKKQQKTSKSNLVAKCNRDKTSSSSVTSDLGLGGEARAVLEYDPGVDFSIDKESLDGDDEGLDSEDDEDEEMVDLEAFKTKVRVDVAARVEGNRRAGGLRTQKGLVRAWKVPRSLSFLILTVDTILRNGLSRL